MRLSDYQISLISNKVIDYFGPKSHVWLFGSRVNDQMRGGDIDLYVEPEIQNAEMLTDAKLHFLLEMHRRLGEQKIDLVLHRTQTGRELPVYKIAKETGDQLI
ncbi:MAG: nucleotidyltransferase domain-containing protein [Mariprofundus sp.]